MIASLITAVLLLVPPQDVGQTTTKCCTEGKANPWAGYNKGITWSESVEDGIIDATVSGKVLMLFQLVGDMRLEGC